MQSGICSLRWSWIRAQAEMQGEQTMITSMRDQYSKCFEMTNVRKPLLRFHLGAPLTRNRIFILLVHKKVAETGIDLKKEAESENMKDDFRMKQTETWSLGRNTKKWFVVSEISSVCFVVRHRDTGKSYFWRRSIHWFEGQLRSMRNDRENSYIESTSALHLISSWCHLLLVNSWPCIWSILPQEWGWKVLSNGPSTTKNGPRNIR